MAMSAEHVSINRVENGWVVTVACAGSHLTLIAKTVEEVAGFVKGMDWVTPRPLSTKYDEPMASAAYPATYPSGRA